jgi:hypothetical protein
MSAAFRSPEDYEYYLYSLIEQFPIIRTSTVTFIRVGASMARVSGELYFDYQVHLMVRERIVFDRLPILIDSYGYEVWKGAEKLYWYDSQPHPNEPSLQSTHPHHKHIEPDIKHNRLPAYGMSFSNPNLPFLIKEIQDDLLQTN